MTKHKIGLFGYGCVGQGFVELLKKAPHINAEVVKVCVKHTGKERPHVSGAVIYDPNEILYDNNIDIIVELIDDSAAAFQIVSEALKQGKKVVSANKKMIAENLKALYGLQQKYNGQLLYEGAVCGSIPVIGTLRNYYNYDGVRGISGILNGSTNYILTKVLEEKLSYEQALEEAQSNGFAESDPTLDVGGFDPSYKLSILIHQVFNTHISPSDILRVGIQQISSADVRFAEENGLKIKLIAKATRSGDAIHAWVAPQFVASSNSFAAIGLEYNAVKLSSTSFDEQLLTGKGAGKLPTGLAVLSDVAAFINNTNATATRAPASLTLDNDQLIEIYLGHKPETIIDWSHFETIKEKLTGKNACYAIGKIRLRRLKTLIEKHPEASVIFTSGENLENNLSKLTYKNTEVEMPEIL